MNEEFAQRPLITPAVGAPAGLAQGSAVRVAWCFLNTAVQKNGLPTPYAAVEYIIMRSTANGWDGYAIQVTSAIATWNTNGPMFERVANSLTFS